MNDNLTPYDLDVLRSASDNEPKVSLVGLASAIKKLVARGFLTPTSGAVGAGYIITDAGLARLGREDGE